MTDTFRALCAELVDAWLKGDDIVGAMNRARATLADEPAVPAPPADGEVAELVEWLKENAEDERQMSGGDNPASLKLDRAAELLERLASPACVVLKPSPELIEAFQYALPGRIEPLQRPMADLSPIAYKLLTLAAELES